MRDPFMAAALEEARLGLREGGIPIGSVLVHAAKVIGRGHNRRVQKASAILHGEMDAIENAGRQPASVYRAATVYTTLSPCAMCSGTILLYGIAKVVIGENKGVVAFARRRGRGAAGRGLYRTDARLHRGQAGAMERGYREAGVSRLKASPASPRLSPAARSSRTRFRRRTWRVRLRAPRAAGRRSAGQPAGRPA